MGQRVTINGETAVVEVGTVAELLRREGVNLAARGVAVALNNAVVRRASWEATPIREGDRIEIVKSFSGG